MCIEVLSTDQHRTEPIVVIAIAIIAVEIEQTGIGAVAPIATANRERIVQPNKVRVVQFNPTYIKLINNFIKFSIF